MEITQGLLRSFPSPACPHQLSAFSHDVIMAMVKVALWPLFQPALTLTAQKFIIGDQSIIEFI
jgi:hypothetical protein